MPEKCLRNDANGRKTSETFDEAWQRLRGAYETAECIASTSSPIICTRYETYLAVVFVTLDGKCDPVRCNGAEFRLDWHEAEKQSK